MIITECEAFGLVFDDLILNNDVECDGEFDQLHAIVLESQVCEEHFNMLPVELVNTDVYRGEQAHEKCGVQGCFNESYAQVYPL